MLTVETDRLLARLHNHPRGWRGRFRRKDLVSVIVQIGRSGEPLSANSLLGFAFDKVEVISEAACLAIQSLLGDVTPLNLAFLDHEMRQVSSWPNGLPRVPKVGPDDVWNLVPSVGFAPFVLGLASFHRNGFVREAATRALAFVSSGDELPFLMIRANDWVAPIREHASAALQTRIAEGDVAAFIRYLPLVSRLRICGRADHDEFVNAVEEVLGRGDSDGELCNGIHSEDRFIRRACARIAVGYKRTQLCERALITASDPVVRVFFVKFLLANLSATAACRLSAELAGDRLVAIRQESLRTAVKRCSENRRERLELGLLDRSLSVRQLAGYYAKKLFDVDLVEFYRSRLTSSKGYRIWACISGLGEHGQKEDAFHLASYVAHGAPRVRRSAVRAVARLDLDSHVELMMDAIRSELPGVSSEASLVLQGHRGAMSSIALEELMLNSCLEHVRQNAFRVLRTLDKWTSLRCSLIAVGLPYEGLVTMGVQAIDHWLSNVNRSYAHPLPSDVDAILKLLESPSLQMSNERRRAIRLCLPKHMS